MTTRSCLTQRRRACPCGFTVIELLVVVAIIAVLMAVLLPALSNARHQGWRSRCASNLGQIMRGWQMYWDDHKGHMIRNVYVNWAYGGADSGYPYEGYERVLNHYVGLDPLSHHDQAELFRCPTDRGNHEAQPSCYQHYGNSYACNLAVVGPTQFGVDSQWEFPLRVCIYRMNERLPDLTLSGITTNPAELVVLGDASWRHHWVFGPDELNNWHHRRGWHHLAFLDGHVGFLRVWQGLFNSDSDYRVLPFRDLALEVATLQPLPGEADD
jgi:prepilin-type N-terminal cleavage/methylation domain-containing protein